MPFKQWFLLNIFTCMNINNICDLLLLFLQNVLSNMVHSLLFCNQGDLIGLSSRLEWLPLLHNVIMFHIGLSLRHHTMPSAFCQAYNWKPHSPNGICKQNNYVWNTVEIWLCGIKSYIFKMCMWYEILKNGAVWNRLFWSFTEFFSDDL